MSEDYSVHIAKLHPMLRRITECCQVKEWGKAMELSAEMQEALAGLDDNLFENHMNVKQSQ